MRSDTTQSIQLYKPMQEAPQQGKASLSVKKGDVITATVVSQDGQHVVLKIESGQLLKAKLMTEGQLLRHTTLEMVVTSGSGGAVNVQMISIASPFSDDALSLADSAAYLAAAGLPDSDEALEVLAQLKRLDAAPTRGLLTTAVRFMRDSALDAKTAVFFALNDLLPTAENSKAFHALSHGKTIGAALFTLAEEAAAPIGQLAGAGQPTAAPDGSPTPGIPVQTAVERLPSAGTAESAAPQPAPSRENVPLAEGFSQRGAELITQLQQAIEAASRHAGPGVPKEAPAAARGEALSLASPPPSSAGADFQAPAHTPLTAEAPSPAESLWKELPRRLLSLFVKADGRLDGPTLQKAVGTAQALAQLKEALAQADGKGHENWTARLGDVAAQAKLTEDISRFLCYHVPIEHQGHKTAEFYVYKQKKHGRAIDPENATVLIGLETENMGRVETLLQVEKRTVTLTFRVEEENAMAMVKERAQKDLYPVCKALRYALADTKVAPLSVPTTPANAQEVLLSAARKPHVYIDCKV